MTDRDIAVLEALNEHRFLSGEQLRRLVLGCSGSRARRRLRKLFDHGFVERISVVAQPTRGIPPFLYTLTRQGAAALLESGVSADAGGVNGASVRHVRHELAVRDFFIALTMALRGTPHRLIDWRYEQELKLAGEEGRGRAERVTHPSLAQPMSFLPDAYFQIDVGGGHSLAFFLEMDMASHPQRVWRQRAELYTAYADPNLALFRRRFGRQTFRVAVVTPPDYRQRSRRDNIVRTIERTVGASQLFLAATQEEACAERILTSVWKQPGRQHRTSIVDTSVGGAAVVVRRARVRARE